MSRILVIRGGAIGDFILTLPAIKLLRDAFPAAHLEILGYKHIVALAEMSGLRGRRPLDRIRAALQLLQPRRRARSANWSNYFGGFQQVISYLFDPDRIFADNLQRAGVRQSHRWFAEDHRRGTRGAATGAPARESRALPGRSGGAASCLPSGRETSIPTRSIAIHPGSGSENKNWPLERCDRARRSRFLQSNEDSRLLLVARRGG